LYLAKYRVYDPHTGRWLSRDPIEEAGGVNLYGYVGGNPVSRIDPSGEGWKETMQAIGIAIGLLGTLGYGPEVPPEQPPQTTQQRPIEPGQVPGRSLPDPAKSTTPVPQLPRSTGTVPTPSTPTAICPPKVPWYFRPPIPIPIVICPECFFDPQDHRIPNEA
jgi:uncharacterized protein RhaS with RHS repeats